MNAKQLPSAAGRCLWHTGIGRGWPASAEEELVFLAELEIKAKDIVKPKPAREDVTFLVVSLREGATISELDEELPGANWQGMYSAAKKLASRRKKSYNSWLHIVEDPGVVALSKHIREAAKLLPGPAARLTETAARANSVEQIIEEVKIVAEKIEDLYMQSQQIMGKLQTATSEDAVEQYSTLLYNPYGHSVWTDPYYLPVRLTEVSPGRVQHLW